MARSKSFLTFDNKMLHFSDDVELVDIITRQQRKLFNADHHKMFFCQTDKHPSISRYKISEKNLNIVLRHFRTTVYTAFIKDLYEEFMLYLKGITKEAYTNLIVSPERLLGEHRLNINAVDVLHHLQQKDLAQFVIDEIFQILENERSTIKLISHFKTKLGIEYDKEIARKAIFYLEIRHKLVHTDGVLDDEFITKYSKYGLNVTAKKKIVLNYSFLLSAKKAIYDLVKDMDQKALALGILHPHTN